MGETTFELDKTTQQERANKTKEKYDAAEETMKTRCKSCFKEIAPVRRCGGHGGGGGGSDSGDDASNEDGMEADVDSALGVNPANSMADELMFGSADWESMILQPDDLDFDEEIISELLVDGLLVINNHSDKGILTFELRCSPNALSQVQRDELKKYFNAIQNELEQFKEENGISDECKKINTDAAGNILSLRITLPSPALYDAFIQRLAKQHLIPLQNVDPKNNERVEYPKGNQFSPTPFATTPKPLDNKNPNASPDEKNKYAPIEANKKEDLHDESFNPSPFSTVLKAIPGQS